MFRGQVIHACFGHGLRAMLSLELQYHIEGLVVCDSCESLILGNKGNAVVATVNDLLSPVDSGKDPIQIYLN